MKSRSLIFTIFVIILFSAIVASQTTPSTAPETTIKVATPISNETSQHTWLGRILHRDGGVKVVSEKPKFWGISQEFKYYPSHNELDLGMCQGPVGKGAPQNSSCRGVATFEENMAFDFSFNMIPIKVIKNSYVSIQPHFFFGNVNPQGSYPVSLSPIGEKTTLLFGLPLKRNLEVKAGWSGKINQFNSSNKSATYLGPDGMGGINAFVGVSYKLGNVRSR